MYRTLVRTLWKPLGLLLIGSGLFLAYLLLKPVSSAQFTFGDNLWQGALELLGLLFALPVLLPASKQEPADARPASRWGVVRLIPADWAVPLLLACAILSYAIGQALWTLNEDVLHLAVLFPSWADAGYLGSYPFVLLAILLLPQQRRSLTSRTRLVFDVLITMSGVVTLSWYFVLGPTIHQGADSILGQLVGTAYPLSTLLLIFCLLLLMMRNHSPAMRPVIFLMFLAFVAIVLTDTVYDYQELYGLYATGSLLDLGWPLGYMLLGLAARALYVLPRLEARSVRQAQENEETVGQPALWQSLLPYTWVPTVGLLLLFIWRRGGDPFLVTGVVVGALELLGLVLVRQLVAMRELHDLYVNNDALTSANSQLEIQATHDALTGLPNRNFLHIRLDQVLDLARYSSIPAALLLLDLDRFKEVNDTLGHDVGDLLLQEIGPRLQGSLCSADLVTRLGGDEFAIILPETDAAGALQTAKNLLEALQSPFLIDHHAFDIGGSIGIALTPEHGYDATTLLRCADVAMYVAKRKQSGCEVYISEIDQHSPRKLALMSELRQAIADGGLQLCYQPKVSLALGHIVGVEALVRWPHPVHGLLSPDEFIPLAERTGLIGPLTRWVFEQAIRQCRDWRRAGLHLKMAVNLSTRTLYDPSLLPTVMNLLQTYEVAPHRLTLEITEGTLMDDPERARVALTGLREQGISISIDDFGTGYSSLAYLKRLPLDEVKIDKAFILGLGAHAEPADVAIVRAVLAMARPMQCEVVAEGVEDRETWTFLRDLGCDLAQGYYLSRPLPASALEQWVRTTPYGVGAQDPAAIA